MMNKKLLFFMLALFCCLAHSNAWAEEQLTIMADERRPYAWIEHGIPRGICYDLVVETMKELKLTHPIQITSFNRGMRAAQSGPNIVFFSVTPTPERNAALKWAGPLVSSDVYIYKLKNAALRLKTREDLRQLEGIGVPQGMQQDLFLQQIGFNVIRFDNIPKTLLGLKNKRVEAIAVGPLALYGAAREVGLDPAEFEQTPILLYKNPLYIAFSKDISNETVQRWQKALDKVKQEKYKLLINTYLR